MAKKRATQKAPKKNKKIHTMDVILVVIAIALTAFTVEMVVIFREFRAIPDTLCTCVFGALAGECGAMAWIKTNKDRKTERKWAKEDKKEERLHTEAATKEEPQ